MLLGCGSWDAPCDALGVGLAGTEAATRELDPDGALAEVPLETRSLLFFFTSLEFFFIVAFSV